MIRLLFLTISLLIGWPIRASQLPPKVKANQERLFSGSAVTNWSVSETDAENTYLVEFDHNGQKQEAYYDASGHLVSHLIHIGNLKKQVKQALTQDYKGAEVRRLVLSRTYKNRVNIHQRYTALLKTNRGLISIHLAGEQADKLSQLLKK